ncbi:MAG: hypothetical protein IJZ92_00820 [Bacteroidaceae bacterium]|nr:hypothetical protein [Bacteroidaceae bacterium]
MLVNNISRREIYIASLEMNIASLEIYIASLEIYISWREIYFVSTLGIFAGLSQHFGSTETDILSHFVSGEGHERLLARVLPLVRAAGWTMHPAGVKMSAEVRLFR